MKILITGVAGFIGFHLAKQLIKNHSNIIGIDNLNDYYDINLKKSRLSILKEAGLKFIKLDITEKTVMEKFFAKEKFNIIIHLAAQAGVRHSIDNPYVYLDSNIKGFFNILEVARHNKIEHLIYASSSSVYGLSDKNFFSENDTTDKQVSLYAASKKSNEVMAYSYSNLYKIPCTGLRLFTVYGPWGRPDMAYFKFVNKILNNEIIDVYGKGEMYRDFTYIDDVITALIKLIPKSPKLNLKINKHTPHEIFNIGNNKPESLEKFIGIIENALDKKAKRNYVPMQLGDVLKTSANIDKINQVIDFVPQTSIEEGLSIFIKWYRSYYR